MINGAYTLNMNISKRYRLLMWFSIGIALISLILYWVNPFSLLDTPQRGIYNRYLFLPFFLLFCLDAIILAWFLWKRPKPIEWTRQKWIFNCRISSIILIGTGIILFIYRVLIPTIEIPYLFSVQTLNLDHVQWTSDVSSMTFCLSGTDSQGNQHVFALDPLFFADTKKSDSIQLQILPYSHTVMEIRSK